jgi:hypothetical protein
MSITAPSTNVYAASVICCNVSICHCVNSSCANELRYLDIHGIVQ